MFEFAGDFHFLRPWWFALLLVIPVLIWVRIKITGTGNNWKKIIDPILYDVLVTDKVQSRRKLAWLPLLLLGICLTAIALAGPTWERIQQPILKNREAMVIVLDLSPSMTATDVSPSRIERSKVKIQDILNARQDGFTSIVVYAGDAHVVAPLTDDISTLEHLLRTLHPTIMPLAGSNTAAAIDLAQELLIQSARPSGRIVLITDGVDSIESVERVHRSAFPVSVIGVGTSKGATIPRMTFPGNQDNPIYVYGNDGRIRLVTDASGNVVIARLDRSKLGSLARRLGGTYSDLTLDNSDINRVASNSPLTEFIEDEDKEFDAWLDMGVWFAIPLALFLLPALRRGVLTICLIFVVVDVRADWIDDLFQTRDQQAHQALIEGDPESAASLFEDQDWRAIAKYRNREYEDAATLFADENSEMHQFNFGNSLAMQGRFEEALSTYEQVLKHNPEHEDAVFNRDLIKRILEEQKQQSDQDSQQSEGEESEDSESQQQQQSGENDEEGDEFQQEQNPAENMEQPQEEDQTSDEQNDQLAEAQQEREQSDTEERWLRRIPDQPGGLLRTKFLKTTQKRIREGALRRPDENQLSW